MIGGVVYNNGDLTGSGKRRAIVVFKGNGNDVLGYLCNGAIIFCVGFLLFKRGTHAFLDVGNIH